MSKTVDDVKPGAGKLNPPDRGTSHSPGSQGLGYSKESIGNTKETKGNNGDRAHMNKQNGRC